MDSSFRIGIFLRYAILLFKIEFEAREQYKSKIIRGECETLCYGGERGEMRVLFGGVNVSAVRAEVVKAGDFCHRDVCRVRAARGRARLEG